MNNVSASRSTMRNIRADIHVKLGGASAGRSGLKRRVEWAFDDEPKASETLVALEKLTVCGYDDEDTVCFLSIASRAICVDMHIILAATPCPCSSRAHHYESQVDLSCDFGLNTVSIPAVKRVKRDDQATSIFIMAPGPHEMSRIRFQTILRMPGSEAVKVTNSLRHVTARYIFVLKSLEENTPWRYNLTCTHMHCVYIFKYLNTHTRMSMRIFILQVYALSYSIYATLHV